MVSARAGIPRPHPGPLRPLGAERECVFGSRRPRPGNGSRRAPRSYLANSFSRSPERGVPYSGPITDIWEMDGAKVIDGGRPGNPGATASSRSASVRRPVSSPCTRARQRLGAAIEGCAVQVSRAVHDQASQRDSSIRAAGLRAEGVQHCIGPAAAGSGRQLERYTGVIGATVRVCTVKVSCRVHYQTGEGSGET